MDVSRARERAEKVRTGIGEFNTALQEEIDALDTAYDAQSAELTEVLIEAKTADVQVPLFGLLWIPCRDTGDGGFERAG